MNRLLEGLARFLLVFVAVGVVAWILVLLATGLAHMNEGL